MGKLMSFPRRTDVEIALLLVTFSTSLLWMTPTSAQTSRAADQVGAVYEIRREVQSAQKSSDRSNGTSTDRDTLIEKVLGVRRDGVELEFDLPKTTSTEDRERDWQFPVRVFKPISGPAELLNRPELEKRIDAWLKKAGQPRSACGHWIFTWNAFKIECDPESALRTAEAMDLRTGALHDGDLYTDIQESRTTTLRRTKSGPEGATLVGEIAIDQGRVLRDQAESDVVIAEITGKTLALDDALRARSGEKISGTLTVTFDTDATGQVWRRTKRTTLQTTAANGATEDRMVTEIVSVSRSRK